MFCSAPRGGVNAPPDILDDAIDCLRGRVNTMKHAGGVELDHFNSNDDYIEAISALERFWEHLIDRACEFCRNQAVFKDSRPTFAPSFSFRRTTTPTWRPPSSGWRSAGFAVDRHGLRGSRCRPSSRRRPPRAGAGPSRRGRRSCARAATAICSCRRSISLRGTPSEMTASIMRDLLAIAPAAA